MAHVTNRNSFLYQALAELYVIDGQYEKAFSLFADVSISGTPCSSESAHKEKHCLFKMIQETSCCINFI